MPVVRSIKLKCGLCGSRFITRQLFSSHTFGSPDLDLRPPERHRSTMYTWVKKCPECGYAYSDIEKDARKHKEYVKSEEYLSCEGTDLKRPLAIIFYRFALIAVRNEDWKLAYNAFMYAAWSSDDYGDTEGARACRNRAISLFDSIEVFKDEHWVVRNADVLRRAGRFEDVIERYSDFTSLNPMLEAIARFQVEKAKAKDTAVYKVADCAQNLKKESKNSTDK